MCYEFASIVWMQWKIRRKSKTTRIGLWIIGNCWLKIRIIVIVFSSVFFFVLFNLATANGSKAIGKKKKILNWEMKNERKKIWCVSETTTTLNLMTLEQLVPACPYMCVLVCLCVMCAYVNGLWLFFIIFVIPFLFKLRFGLLIDTRVPNEMKKKIWRIFVDYQ